MKKIAALLFTGSLLVVLSGCTAYKHNKAGDAAAATGDMRGAVYHYERAMSHKEKYGRDTDFLSKLSVARSRVAYDEAQRLRAAGRYELAIDQLRESMRQDPGYAEPAALLLGVLKEAARWRYTQAIEAADAGDLDAAREHLTRSMQHDLTDESAAVAMASLTPDALDTSTPGLAAYRTGLSLSAERRWLQAGEALTKSVGANGNLLPARAALYEARSQAVESRRLQRDGQALIDRVTMGPAIKSLTRSLDIWPYNTRAGELLIKAKGQLALADEQFVKATQAAGQAKWDDAIAQADSGLTIDRSHPALGELRGALPRRAAADYTRRGDAHAAKGELDRAHRAYGRALGYRKTYREARLGMAAVYAAWGEQHEQAGRLGAAMLHYTKGQSYTRSKAPNEGVVRTGAALRDRLGMGLSVSAKEQRRGEVDPGQLDKALAGTLKARQSRGLAVRGKGMPYELRLSITRATMDERRTDTDRRTHHYTTQERCPNPEYAHIAARLRDAERDHDRACRAYRRAAGHGHGKHHRENDAHVNHHFSSVHNAKSRVDRLRRELACTPRQIEVTIDHDWHYTVETYTKTGELRVLTELVDTATGKVVKQLNHEASFEQSDDRTLNANPSVGVRTDELNLSSDDTVRGALVDELASAAGPWAVNAAVDHRLAQINAAVDAYEQDGKTAEALEARVDAAVLLGIVDRKASAETIQKLTQSHAR